MLCSLVLCCFYVIFFSYVLPLRENKQHSPISPGVINRCMQAHLRSSYSLYCVIYSVLQIAELQ